MSCLCPCTCESESLLPMGPCPVHGSLGRREFESARTALIRVAAERDELRAEVERLKRLLDQRGRDAADAEDKVERLRHARDSAVEVLGEHRAALAKHGVERDQLRREVKRLRARIGEVDVLLGPWGGSAAGTVPALLNLIGEIERLRAQWDALTSDAVVRTASRAYAFTSEAALRAAMDAAREATGETRDA